MISVQLAESSDRFLKANARAFEPRAPSLALRSIADAISTAERHQVTIALPAAKRRKSGLVDSATQSGTKADASQ